jgi:hypothetical protein
MKKYFLFIIFNILSNFIFSQNIEKEKHYLERS